MRADLRSEETKRSRTYTVAVHDARGNIQKASVLISVACQSPGTNAAVELIYARLHEAVDDVLSEVKP